MTQILTYANPLWDGYLADPFLVRWQGSYYAYGTGAADREGKRFPLLRSPDLTTWEYLGGALAPLPHLAPNADYWAPEVAERDGTFYLYYSASPAEDVTRHRLRVATASHPAGPFHDTGREILPDEGFSIDAHPFRDPRDGRWYLFYARDFLDRERVGTGLAVVSLADDMRTPAGEPRAVLTASADWQIYERNREMYGKTWDAWHTLEGAFVIERNGLYYCFYSGGNWQTPGYGVSFAVAEHPLGPWRNENGNAVSTGAVVLQGKPEQGILGPGHNSMVTAPDNQSLLLVYHAWDADRTARRLCIDPLLWTADGPRCDGPTVGEREIRLPIA